MASTVALLLAKRSANLRQQVLAHFSKAKHDTALARDTWRVEWREAAGELGARLGEFALTASARTPLATLCSWQLVRHGEGDYRPQLVYAHELDFARTPDLFWPLQYPARSQPCAAQTREAHRLCHTQLGIGTAKAGGLHRLQAKELPRGLRQPGANAAQRAPDERTGQVQAQYLALRRPGGARRTRRIRHARVFTQSWNGWRLLGTVHDEAALNDLIDQNGTGRDASGFDPDLYRIFCKFLKAGKIRVQPLF